MGSDIEIARKAKMKPIADIAKKLFEKGTITAQSRRFVTIRADARNQFEAGAIHCGHPLPNRGALEGRDPPGSRL